MSKEEQPPEMEESFIKVKTLRTDLIKSVLDLIPTRPGLSSDIAEKELSLFQFRNRGTDQYEVCIPKNLESFADNWVVRLGVVAAQNLGATFLASSEDVKELKFHADYKEYLHGMASAFKQSCMEGGVRPDRTSGKYHQGLNWVVAQTLLQRKDADLFKTNFTSPWVAFTGNLVWNANAPVWMKNLYQLVTISAKHIKIAELGGFLKSPEQVISEKFVKTWDFENRAVFSDYEITLMKSRYEKELDAYNNWLKSLQSRWRENFSIVKEEYGKLTTVIKPYNSRIGAIASIRANAIFRSTKKGKKDTIPTGLTREARLEYLSFGAWIQATNPTGLASDDRIETKLSISDSNVAAEEFIQMYEPMFRISKCPPELLKPWLELAVNRANALLKD